MDTAKSSLSSKGTWFLVTAVTLVFLLAVALDVTPYLRGPAPMDVEWRWPRYAEPPYDRLWLPSLALLLYLGLFVWMDQLDAARLSRRHRVALLVALILAALFVQGGMLYLARPDVATLLFERNASPLADGYYTAALKVDDVGSFLQTYPAQMPAFLSDHPRTHPPGFPLLHWVVGHTLGRWPPLRTWVRWHACPTLRVSGLAADQMTSVLVVGLATPLLSSLALLPIYALARRRGGVQAGLRAAAIFALVPAFTLFAPQMDQIFPLLAALILWAFVVGWERQRLGWLFASGVLLSLATFLSLGLAALALWLSLYAAARWLADSPGWTWQRLAAAGLVVGAGTVSLWLICWLAFGLDPLAMVRTGMAQHFEIVTGRRDYRLWVGYNLYDFAAFLGLPLAFQFLAQVLTSFRYAAGRRWHKVNATVMSTALTILILDISGTSRGEVARLWLFLTPPVVLAAALSLKDRRLLTTLAVLQAVSLLVLGLFLDVVPIVPLPALDRARSAELLPVQYETPATFGGQIELLGYDLTSSTIQPGETLGITLHWRALVEPQQNYKVFVHLLDPAGTLRAQADGVPVDWTLPTTCWVRGETIVDPYTLTFPPNAPPGDYTLALGFYREATEERLPVGERDHVRLEPVTVSPSP
jgi:4-amino-4-deoxy-L-arabinose transferase-like glycosyltransferase